MSTPIYPAPQDPRVAILVEALGEVQREHFEERAALIEYESLGVTRAEAEVEALLEVLALPPRPAPVRLFRLALAEGCQWVVTTDPALAAALLQSLGGSSVEECDLSTVVRDHYQGLAVLAVP